MRRLRFGINLVIFMLPLVILGVGANRFVRRTWEYLLQNPRLANILSTEATRALGRKVQIGSIRITGSLWSDIQSRVELGDVSIAQGARSGAGSLFHADRVVVLSNFRRLILPTDLTAPLLDRVELVGPTVSIAHDSQGHWNFEDLFKKPQAAAARPFMEKLTFEQGTVLYSDKKLPAPQGVASRPLQTRLDNASGVVLFRPDKSLSFDVAGNGEPTQADALHVVGIVSPNPLRLNIHLTANRVSAPLLAERLLLPTTARVTSGTSDLELTLNYLPREDKLRPKLSLHLFDLNGSIKATSVSAVVPRLDAPITDINGQALFTSNAVYVANLSGKIAGMEALLRGSILGLREPISLPAGITDEQNQPQNLTLSLQGALPDAQIAQLTRALHLVDRLKKQSAEVRRELQQARGRGRVDFQVTGAFADPAATFQARFATLQAGRYKATNVEVHGRYVGKTLYADLRGRYAQGNVVARVQASMEPSEAFRAEAHGRKLHLGELGLAAKKPLQGIGNLDVVAEGKRGQRPQVDGQVQVSDLKYDKTLLDSVYASVETQGDNLLVRNLRVEDTKGFVLARGGVNLKSQALNLRVEGDELDIEALYDAVAPPPRRLTKVEGPEPLRLAGAGYLRGRVTGTLKKPLLRGRLSAFGFEANQLDLDTLEADFDLSSDALIISRGVARRYPGQVHLSGFVSDPFKKEPTLSLTASVEDLELTEIFRLAGVNQEAVPITGALSAELRVEGSPTAPRVVANNIQLHDVLINDLPVQDAALVAEYGPEGLKITQASARVAGGTVSASGSMDKEGKLALSVQGEGLQLEPVAETTSNPQLTQLKGTVGFTATVGGTKRDPTAEAQLNAQGLSLNAVPLGDLIGALTYQDKSFHAQNVTLGDPKLPVERRSLFLSHLDYNTETKSLAANAKVQEFAIQRLRELFQNSAYVQSEEGETALETLGKITGPIEGVFSGDVALAGTWEQPVAELTWDARGIGVNQHKITALTGSARLTRDRVVIPSPAMPMQVAHLESPDAVIDARGDIAFKGPLSGDISAYNVNLKFLQNWLQENIAREITGTGDVFVVASGKTKSPVLDVSINLRDVAYRGEKLDRIDIDHAQIQEGALTADNITLVRKETIKGQTVNYVGKASGTVEFSWKPPFIPTDARLNFQASIPKQSLQMLSAFSPRLLGSSVGELSAQVQATGTRAHPNLNGTLTVQASRLRAGIFATGLRDVDALFVFDGDRLKVQRFAAQSQVYDPKTGEPVAKMTGSPITLTGSLPLLSPDPLDESVSESEGLRLSADTVFFSENPLPGVTSGSAKGVAMVDLKLEGAVTEPKISGLVTVRNAEATLPRDFGGLQSGGFALPVNPAFDLGLRLADNVRLKNQQLDARTSGTIMLTGHLTDPQLRGTLALNEGRLILPTARFTILPPGSLRLLYPVVSKETFGQPTLSIDVNLKAQTDKWATSLAGVRKQYHIIVTARGPLTGVTTDPITGEPLLALSFQTDPPDLASNAQTLSQRVVGLLGGADLFNQFGRNPEQALAGELANVFTSSYLPGIFDKPAEQLGFEQLAIGYDPVQRLTLTVSRHLFGPLYVNYNRSLSADREIYQLKVSLRFRDRYQLSYTTDEQKTNQLLIEGIWQY